MRRFGYTSALLLAAGCALLTGKGASAADAPAKEAASGVILMTEGIVGGFVQAHVRQQTLIVPEGDAYRLLVMKQPARGAEQSFLSGRVSADEFGALVKKLNEAGLWKLPVEKPTGSQDIYKLDTSVAALVGGRFWRNGGPAGCVHGESEVQPSEEQQAAFGRIVAAVKEFAEKRATEDADGEAFQAALLAAHGSLEKRAGKGLSGDSKSDR